MSDKEKQELIILNLGKALVELVGEEQAIADLKELWKRHPEMFKDENDIARVTRIVALEPEIIIKNPTPLSEKDYIAGKKLDEEKMGEIGVRKDENIAKIFHVNQKNAKKMGQLERKEVIYKQSMVGTPTSYTQAQSLDERLVQKNISSTAENIIPQTNENKDNTKQKSSFFSKMKNSLCKVKEGLNIGKEKINNDEIYLSNENLKNLDKDTKDDENKQDKNSNTQNSNKTLRKRK